MAFMTYAPFLLQVVTIMMQLTIRCLDTHNFQCSGNETVADIKVCVANQT